MDEIGVVKRVDGNTATVVIQRTAACDHCVKDDCDVTTEGIETEAINAVHAKEGQTVKLVMRAHIYIKGMFVLYIIPVLALIIGAVLGQDILPSYFVNTDPQALAAAGGFFLLFISLFIVKLLSSRMEKNTEYKSVIEKIVE